MVRLKFCNNIGQARLFLDTLDLPYLPPQGHYFRHILTGLIVREEAEVIMKMAWDDGLSVIMV